MSRPLGVIDLGRRGYLETLELLAMVELDAGDLDRVMELLAIAEEDMRQVESGMLQPLEQAAFRSRYAAWATMAQDLTWALINSPAFLFNR